jgi:hypothetical protein
VGCADDSDSPRLKGIAIRRCDQRQTELMTSDDSHLWAAGRSSVWLQDADDDGQRSGEGNSVSA